MSTVDIVFVVDAYTLIDEVEPAALRVSFSSFATNNALKLYDLKVKFNLLVPKIKV